MVRAMSYDAPFAGLKVIDLSQGIAGPYCAMLLAQHGANVIKVENIGEGDWARTLGVRYGSHSAYSIIGNLGKRSLAVDLKSEAGKQVVWRLLQGADVFLEGFRPGVIQRHRLEKTFGRKPGPTGEEPLQGQRLLADVGGDFFQRRLIPPLERDEFDRAANEVIVRRPLRMDTEKRRCVPGCGHR